jgi:hypothetical protein
MARKADETNRSICFEDCLGQFFARTCWYFEVFAFVAGGVAIDHGVEFDSCVAMVSGFDFRYALDFVTLGSGASRLAICNGAPAFFSLAIQREKPIAPFHRNPGNFKPARAAPK